MLCRSHPRLFEIVPNECDFEELGVLLLVVLKVCLRANFDGTENAQRAPFAQAHKLLIGGVLHRYTEDVAC